MTDSALVQDLRSTRPDKAIQQLYQYFPVVKRFILKNGGDSDDAKDVFQEGVLALLETVQKPHFELRASLQTLLFSICKYRWKSELQKRNKLVPISFEIGEDPSAEQWMIDYQEEQQRRHLATLALSALGKRCWEIIQTFYYEGLSMVAIAKRFGFSSEKIAKNQKYKCLEKARNELASLKSLTLN
jgi:RNA polymerase sigma factor (sigma-70 family)